MIPVNIMVSVYNAVREIWSKRRVIAYYFKKIVLRKTEVIRLKQVEATNATEENLNPISHAIPTSRGIQEIFEKRDSTDMQLRIIVTEDCKVENMLDEDASS